MLQAKRLNDSLMALLVVLCLPVELFFKTPDASQVLLLLEQDAVPLQVCIFYPLLAFISQLLDGLLFLFIESDSLLLVL